MKTTAYEMGRVMKSVIASLFILTSLFGVSKGENADKVVITEKKTEKHTRKPIPTTEDWGSSMTAGWAIHIIKHSNLY